MFRTYSTSKMVKVAFLDQHKSLLPINPAMPLCAIPYSFTGFPRIDEYSERLPQGFEEHEGKGSHLDMPWEGYQKKVEKALGMKEDKIGGGIGMKVIGGFG